MPTRVVDRMTIPDRDLRNPTRATVKLTKFRIPSISRATPNPMMMAIMMKGPRLTILTMARLQIPIPFRYTIPMLVEPATLLAKIMAPWLSPLLTN